MQAAMKRSPFALTSSSLSSPPEYAAARKSVSQNQLSPTKRRPSNSLSQAEKIYGNVYQAQRSPAKKQQPLTKSTLPKQPSLSRSADPYDNVSEPNQGDILVAMKLQRQARMAARAAGMVPTQPPPEQMAMY
mmetsp:Transcript_22958/g.39378  ORF Transcript_22958/g.39378 Transcript_22958/m.39378 type:complete len:132 (-) Transcript_22958:971-1366(-)